MRGQPPDTLVNIASVITSKYIGQLKQGKKPNLEDFIVKELNSEGISKPNLAKEITFVVNRKINDYYYSISKNKFYRFDIANPDRVAERLKMQFFELHRPKAAPIDLNKVNKLLSEDSDEKIKSAELEMDAFIEENLKKGREELPYSKDYYITKVASVAQEQVDKDSETAVVAHFKYKKAMEDATSKVKQALSEHVSLKDIATAVFNVVEAPEDAKELLKTAMDYIADYYVMSPRELMDQLNSPLEKVKVAEDDPLIQSLLKLAAIEKESGFWRASWRATRPFMNISTPLNLMMAPKWKKITTAPLKSQVI